MIGEIHELFVKATFRVLHFETARFAAASSTVGRTCVNNEQNSKGPGSRSLDPEMCKDV